MNGYLLLERGIPFQKIYGSIANILYGILLIFCIICAICYIQEDKVMKNLQGFIPFVQRLATRGVGKTSFSTSMAPFPTRAIGQTSFSTSMAPFPTNAVGQTSFSTSTAPSATLGFLRDILGKSNLPENVTYVPVRKYIETNDPNELLGMDGLYNCVGVYLQVQKNGLFIARILMHFNYEDNSFKGLDECLKRAAYYINEGCDIKFCLVQNSVWASEQEPFSAQNNRVFQKAIKRYEKENDSNPFGDRPINIFFTGSSKVVVVDTINSKVVDTVNPITLVGENMHSKVLNLMIGKGTEPTENVK